MSKPCKLPSKWPLEAERSEHGYAQVPVSKKANACSQQRYHRASKSSGMNAAGKPVQRYECYAAGHYAKVPALC